MEHSSSSTPERRLVGQYDSHVSGGHSNNYADISAAGQARQHNGNVYNTNTNYYTVRQKRSDETLSDEGLNKALLKTAAEGQSRRVEALVQQGADPDYADGDGMIAPHHACLSGFEDTVDALLDMSVDVNAFSKLYGTPVCVAALKGRLNVVRTLIDSRANLSSLGGCLGSALHAACASGDVSTLDLLMGKGLPPDITRYYSSYFTLKACGREMGRGKGSWFRAQPLYLAASIGTVEVVQFLIDKGADVDAMAQSWDTKDDFNIPDGMEHFVDPKEGTALMVATGKGRPDIVRSLLYAGADPDLENSNRSTALMQAAQKGSVRCAKILLDHGSNIALRDPLGNTAALCAADAGELEVLRLLVEKGDPVENRNIPGYTATTLAAAKGYGECLRFLVESGATINCVDEKGCTPMKYAAERGHFGCVKYLLQKGADATRANKALVTPLHYAAFNGRDAIAQTLVQSGTDINAKTDLGMSPLIAAAMNGHTSTIQTLIDLGADIRIAFLDNKTALDVAKESGHKEAVKVLKAARKRK